MDNQYLNTISRAGGDSGGSSAPPSEIPDSLHSKTYAKVLDLLCEGPIEGLVNGDNSIYFNGTPLMNKDGSYNFKDVTLGVRLGTQDQLPIDNFNQIESEYAINTEITNITPQTFTVSDPVVTKVRVALAIPSLYYQEDDGDIVGTSVSYAMYMQKNGSPGTGAVVTPGTIDN